MWVLALLVACTGTEAPEASGGGGRTPAPATEPVVATVGEHGFVSESEFAGAAARKRITGDELTLEDRKEVLDALVTDEVLFQEAFDQGLYRDPKVRKLMVNLLLREHVGPQLKGVEVSDEEAKAYFDEHIADFRMPEKAQVRKIYIGYGDGVRSEDDAMKIAKDLRTRIVADPTKFRDLAMEYSEDAFKRRGGDMGYVDNVPESPYPQELLQVVFSIEPGRVSEPFLAGGGVNVVLVDARREAIERTFEQMKGTVLRRMRSERLTAATDQYTKDLLAATEVTVDEERLAAVQVDPRMATPIEPDDLGLDMPDGPEQRHKPELLAPGERPKHGSPDPGRRPRGPRSPR
ncbi:MAG: peptidyl-prolyl cis-trans isomerase [Alphaproteobacteria bacterium]|nr:peptidyl-prolyl cis-trans isomerase [Alphaproteobacteria bacterium]MCB9699039.1 peptidyl-prolyl cis-trans isomerase [Alphaproteobacteria bacterium]